MPEKPRIFLSAVTKELGSVRDQLAVELRRRGCELAVQEEFRTTSGTLLEKLHDCILECHAVVCLMGERYGAEPPSAEATRYAFSFTQDGSNTGVTPRHSYTQWEYLFARRMNKATFVFLPSKTAPRDSSHKENPEPEDLQQLQQHFIQKDVRLDGRDRTYFESLEQIKDHLAAIDFQKLLHAEYHQLPLKTENPYIGLRHFEETERDYFFGRDQLIADLIAASEESPLLMVLGASGSGKSSAVRAGLIPSWRERTGKKGRVVEFTPDEDAFEGFYLGVNRAGYSQQDAKPAKIASPYGIRERFETLHKPGEPWLVFIDQFEQIFTRTPGREESKKVAFIAALVDVASDPPEGLRVVLAMRDDFFSNLEGHPTLFAITDKHFRRVARMDEGELRAVIQRPAASHGVAFEPGLVRLILDDLADSHGRLPLPYLQYTLEALWEKDEPTDRVLNIDSYKAIGGVRGALQQRVTSYFNGLGASDQQSLRRILLRLVEIGETQVPVSRAARKADLATGTDAAVLEQLLSEQKLLVAQEGAGDDRADSVVELAHEALITGWDEFEKWVNESREAIALRNRLREDAEVYAALQRKTSPSDGRRARSELWAGSRLERAVELRDGGDFVRIGGLNEAEADFLDESEREKRTEVRRLNRRLALLSGLTMVAIVAGITTFGLYLKAEEEKSEAQYREGLSWFLRAELAAERGYLFPDTLIYAAKAIGFEGFGRPKGATKPERLIRAERNPEAFAEARDWITEMPAYMPVWSSPLRPETPATALDVDPSGIWLALGSQEGASLYNLQTGEVRELNEIGPVTDLAFDPADSGLLAIAAKGRLSLYDKESGTFEIDTPETDKNHRETSAIAWSPEGILIRLTTEADVVVSGEDGETVISTNLFPTISDSVDVNFEVLPPLRIIASPSNEFVVAHLSGLGIRIIFPAYKASSSQWDRLSFEKFSLDSDTDSDLLDRLMLSTSSTCLAISPDGRQIATGYDNGEVAFWDAETATERRGSHRFSNFERAPVVALAWRGDGRGIAAGLEDGRIQLWSLTSERPVLEASLTGHLGALTRIAFSPDGRMLVSAAMDGSAKIWEASGLPFSESNFNLYDYVHSKDSWYEFRSSSVLAWKGGEGFGFGEATSKVIAKWNQNGVKNKEVILTDAENAANEGRWQRVSLKSSELRQLGYELPDELAFKRALTCQPFAATKQTTFVNGEGIPLIWCPPTGAEGFRMGSPEDEIGRMAFEIPHQVILTTGFWLGKYEVTQAEWLAIMGINPATTKTSGLTAPVETLSWSDAVEFCQRLTDRERIRGTILPGWEYRLPTEAQWEYACRAGTQTPWSFGSNPSDLWRFGNYNEISGGFGGFDSAQNDRATFTAPVGSYEPNAWGFYDMHGNVSEWCMDAASPYKEGAETDPFSSNGDGKVMRGGGYGSSTIGTRSSQRIAIPAGDKLPSFGLRIALVRIDES